jgi:hypothetical protein
MKKKIDNEKLQNIAGGTTVSKFSFNDTTDKELQEEIQFQTQTALNNGEALSINIRLRNGALDGMNDQEEYKYIAEMTTSPLV